MATLFSLFSYLFFQGIGFVLLVAFVVLFVFWSINKFHSRQTAFLFALLAAGWLLLVVVPVGMPNLAQYPFSLKTFGPGIGPVLPAGNVIKFFFRSGDMERVKYKTLDNDELKAMLYEIDRQRDLILKGSQRLNYLMSKILQK